MRKITLLLAFIGMMSLQSCTVNEVREDTIDNDTISQVYEVTRSFTPSNNFSTLIAFPQPIFNSDMVLVYRLAGVSGGVDVWKLMPETYFFPDGTLDFGYDFDFTRFDVNIFMHGFDLAGVSPNFRVNQVLRIVIVPGFFGKQAAGASPSFNDYYEVVRRYGIQNVTKLP